MNSNYFDYLYNGYTNTDLIREYESLWNQSYPDVIRINNFPIHFDKTSKKILVTLSGGADSAILFYILAKLISDLKLETKLYAVTVSRFYKTKPWLEISATDVFSYVKNRFPNIVAEHIWGFMPPALETVTLKELNVRHIKGDYADVLYMTEYQDYLIKKHNFDYMYSGTTMNPDIKNGPAFRDQDQIKENWFWIIADKNINPFAMLKKNFTIAQYYNYNVIDLLELTRSCEGDIKDFGIVYKHNNKIPPVCGECFFCKERQWGEDNKQEFLNDC